MPHLNQQRNPMPNTNIKLNSKITQRATLALLLAAPVLYAQSTTSVPAPPQLAVAKSIFISNASEGVGTASDAYYNQFIAAVQNLNHFTIVMDPAQADLVLEFGLSGTHNYPNPDTWSVFETLRITDPKSRIVLWSVSEADESASRKNNMMKNAENAANALAADLQRVCTAPPATH